MSKKLKNLKEKKDKQNKLINLENRFCASNYQPLKVVITKGRDEFLYDINGKKYIDMMSAYSSVSLGHSNKKIYKTLKKVASKIGVISRAYYNEYLPKLSQKITSLTQMDKFLPMNSGAEAVETAIKAARKWGEKIKGIDQSKSEIIVCKNNFHGRTLGVISCSSEEHYRDGFGPFLSGIKIVDFNSISAIEKEINENTVAILIEPIQGEGGIVIPDKGYLKNLRIVCNKNNILLMCDEIQTGLGRTGKLFAYEHEKIYPDIVIIGKALGGGLYPVSGIIGRCNVMQVFDPGSHGSTFGGNPLACALALSALKEITNPKLLSRVNSLGDLAIKFLKDNLSTASVKEVRGRGLFIGIELNIPARPIVDSLVKRGILTKDTHETIIRIAPPLIISKKSLLFALKVITQEINKN